MLTPQELLEVVDTMQPIIDGLNAFITQDVIRRAMLKIGRGEEFLLTGTDTWQIQLYQEAGGHLDDLQKELQRFTKSSDAELKAIFEDAGIRAWARDDAFYTALGYEALPLAQSEQMLRILENEYKRTNNTVRNFTRTTASASQTKFVNVLDEAHFKVMTGAQSYTAAVKDAVKALSLNQTKVTYPTGHTDTIETAVLRAVRTGVGQASGSLSMQGMIERDYDLIRVSAHLGARYGDGGENPSNHFWWQGKLYSRTGKTADLLPFYETTGFGTGEGLCGWNCRHSFGPGDREHNPFATFDSEDNKKAYDLSQTQRRYEAMIRQSKLKVLGLETALKYVEDEEAKATLQSEYDHEALILHKRNQKYNDFCEQYNLKKFSDRVSVAQWNRSQASKATAAARRELKKQQNS